VAAKESAKQSAWLSRYLKNGFNATEAARHVGYKNPEKSGWENSKKLQIQIDSALEEFAMGKPEVLARIAAQARSDIGDYITIRRVKYRESLSVTREAGMRRLGQKIEDAQWQLEHASLSENQRDELEGKVAQWQERVERWGKEDAPNIVHLEGEGPEYERVEEFIDVEAAKRDGNLHLIKRYKRSKDGVVLEPYDAQKALDMLARVHSLYSEPLEGDQGRFDEYLEQIKDARAKYDGDG
jgi:hypothetical protein